MNGEPEPIEIPVSDLNTVDWATVDPVRRFGFFQQQQRNPGWLYSVSSGGKLIPCESRLEFDRLLAIDHDPQTERICVQPLRIHWKEGDLVRSHVPDALICRRNLAPELVNISSETARDREDILARQSKARELAHSVGWGYRRLVGPPDPQTQTTLRTLQAFRGRLVAHDAERVLDAFKQNEGGEAPTVGSLAERLGGGPLAMGAVMAAIADGVLHVDLAQPLGQATRVFAGRTNAEAAR